MLCASFAVDSQEEITPDNIELTGNKVSDGQKHDEPEPG